jgi:hypothetical protein
VGSGGPAACAAVARQPVAAATAPAHVKARLSI